MKRTTFLLIGLLIILTACDKDISTQPQPVGIPEINIVPPQMLPAAPQYEPPPTEPYMAVPQSAPVTKIEVTKTDFFPKEIRVNKGDKVRLQLTAVDADHTFVLNAFRINEELQRGEDVLIEFTADKTGAFSFITDKPGDLAQGKLYVR